MPNPTHPERFVVRDATGPTWDWLPDWCVIDTLRQVRVAAYDKKEDAANDAEQRNQAEGPVCTLGSVTIGKVQSNG